MEYDDELERMRRRRQRTSPGEQPRRRESGQRQGTPQRRVSRQYQETPRRTAPGQRQETSRRTASRQYQETPRGDGSYREVRRQREPELNIIEFDDYDYEARDYYERDYDGNEYDEEEYDEIEYEERPRRPSPKKKTKKKKKRRFGFFKLLLLLMVMVGGYLAYKFLWTGFGVWTVAVFGVDSRNGNLEAGALSDVEMLCVIDRGSGEIKLLSVYRDTYMEIHPDGTYHKINEAYFKGGHEQAIQALERNLDVQIDDYATFNWKAVADAITILGGIDLEISDSEFKYINGFITETVESTGLGSHHLEHAGMNHLDGVQAVAYARLRLMDTDYNRTARQRLVIQLALNKAKEADLKTLTTLVQAIVPQLSTSIGIDDILPMARNVKKYHVQETGGFPFSRGETNIGKKDCVIPLTLESNVVQLHQFLYGTENYVPSETVRQISAKIASDSGMGQVAENAPEAKIVGQRALEGGGSPEGSGSGSNPTAPPQTAPPQTQPQAVPVDAPTEGAGEESSAEESSEESSLEEETGEQDGENVAAPTENGSLPGQGNTGPGGGGTDGPGRGGPGEGSSDINAPGSGGPGRGGPVDIGSGTSVSDNPVTESSQAGPHVYDEKPVIETEEVGPGVP